MVGRIRMLRTFCSYHRCKGLDCSNPLQDWNYKVRLYLDLECSSQLLQHSQDSTDPRMMSICGMSYEKMNGPT
jgi:hypothetical protein